jgi:hypothetical protein
LTAALQSEIGKAASKLVRPRFQLDGRFDNHQCDLAVVNGKPYAAINSFSFEMPESQDLIKAIHAATWTADDMKQKDPNFPIALVALPPKQPSALYDKTIRVFTDLKAEVVPEDKLPNWSKELASAVNVGLQQHMQRPGLA